MSSFSITALKFLLVLQCALLLVSIEASVHEYGGARFLSKGNAFVVHGGSEGIYSSIPNQNDSSTSSIPGDSFIR